MPVSLQVTLNCLRRRFSRQERKNKEQLGVETTATHLSRLTQGRAILLAWEPDCVYVCVCLGRSKFSWHPIRFLPNAVAAIQLNKGAKK